MKALKYLGVHDVRWAEVDAPRPAAGQALIKVTAAGVCQTDVHVRASDEAMIPFGTTLGHEIAGTIESLPDGVVGFEVGQPVVVHPVWSCGVCSACVAGHENACRNTGNRLHPAATPGVSVDGGIADHVVAPVSALVPADGIGAPLAAILADAGLVPYHSISAVRDQLRPGSSAVVIGLGGLGQFAVQLLRALTPARIVAIDIRDSALAAVADKVDLAVRSDDPDLVAKVYAATGDFGAEFVLDLVGNDATLALDGQLVTPYGAIRVPGLSDGTFAFQTSQLQTSLPWGASLTRPYSGTHQDLFDLVALARTRDIGIDTAEYAFDDAITALDDLAAGRVTGRAVLVR
jgi:alcohol dehydrogenase, propanol-preferring